MGADRAVDPEGEAAFAGVWRGEKTGPSPVGRARRGSKHHLIACGRGSPLAVSLTGGNRNEITQMLPLVDAIPPVRGRWVVERTIAWLRQYRRLRVRSERRADIHEVFLAIGCSLICLKLLQTDELF